MGTRGMRDRTSCQRHKTRIRRKVVSNVCVRSLVRSTCKNSGRSRNQDTRPGQAAASLTSSRCVSLSPEAILSLSSRCCSRYEERVRLRITKPALSCAECDATAERKSKPIFSPQTRAHDETSLAVTTGTSPPFAQVKTWRFVELGHSFVSARGETAVCVVCRRC